jgi:CrcB protein
MVSYRSEEGHTRDILLVLIGGGIGSAGRYFVVAASNRLLGASFPWGTMLVNLAGCLVIGFVVGLADRSIVSRAVRILLVTGFLGGFTTLSTFSLESVRMILTGSFGRGLANIGVNVVLGMVLTLCGFYAAARI